MRNRRILASGGSRIGVSELISSLLVLFITLALGAVVVVMIDNYSYNVSTLFKSDVERKAADLMKSLDVVMASGSGSTNEVRLVVSNGVVKLRVIAVYVDDVPVEGVDLVLDPLDIRVVDLKSPVKLAAGHVFKVKVVYEGGEVVAYGYTYE